MLIIDQLYIQQMNRQLSSVAPAHGLRMNMVKLFSLILGCLMGFVLMTIGLLITELSAPDLTMAQLQLEMYSRVKSSPPVRDVVVRSVYFDDRPRYQSKHENSSVFMLEVKKEIVQQNLIIGCGAGDQVTQQLEVRLCGVYTWIHENPNLTHLTHDEVMVDCFDLPTYNGSDAFIIYKPYNTSAEVVITYSERQVMMPATPPQQYFYEQLYPFTIISCTRVFDHPPWLNEWLQYQRTIGIDHIHFVALNSFEDAGGLNNTLLKEMIEEGYVSVDVWKEWLSDSEIYYHSQILALEDCIYRFRGTYDYALTVDTDDFFIPRVSGQKDLHYYVRHWCRHSGSCKFPWIEYYPDCGLKYTDGMKGNITAALVSSVYHRREVRKSLHRLSAVLDIGIHHEWKLMKGYRTRIVPPQRAYIAHIRQGIMPQDGLC